MTELAALLRAVAARLAWLVVDPAAAIAIGLVMLMAWTGA